MTERWDWDLATSEHVADENGRFVRLEDFEAEKEARAELQTEFSANVDHLDLMVDEFGRIRALMMGGHPAIAEVQQLCERAIEQTKQRVPVIQQRDDALRMFNEATAERDAEKAERMRWVEWARKLGAFTATTEGVTELFEAEAARADEAERRLEKLLAYIDEMPNPHHDPMRHYYNQMQVWKDEARGTDD